MLKGAIHIHSTYSDGEFTLSQLREVFRSAGCAFVCMTDHAESFDARKLAVYQKECESLSGESFRLIPGLEYECRERMHILGYGMSTLMTSQDPEEVIRAIDALGGISVIAHPKDAFFEWIESFEVLPQGIEVWNSKYDGRYAPRPGCFSLLQRLQQRSKKILAYYGQDLHWKRQYRELFTFVNCPAPTREGILNALRGGDYIARKAGIELPADGRLPNSLLQQFAVIHRRYDRMRRFAKNLKARIDRLGLRMPDAIKARLRRIF